MVSLRSPRPFGAKGRIMRRRELLVALVALCVTRLVIAQADTVPLALQAKLLAKVAKYDKNFESRARGLALISVVIDKSVTESRVAGQVLHRELEALENVGGLPFRVQDVIYSNEGALRQHVDTAHVSVVYVTPGMGKAVTSITRALSGANVLTVSAVPDDVPNGAVLGFDLVSSQPKLLINLASALRQNVAFEPQALKLMKVYR